MKASLISSFTAIAGFHALIANVVSPSGDSRRQVENIRDESHLWLSGTTAIDAWLATEPMPFNGLRLSDTDTATHTAAQGPVSDTKWQATDAHFAKIISKLHAGEIRSHRQLNVLLQEVLPSSLISPSPNQVNIPPPVDCQWGTEDLLAPDGKSRIGYLDYIFPPQTPDPIIADAVLSQRRIVVTCPHVWDVGGSFSNFRALAWTDGIPVFGFRLDLEAASKLGWIKDRWHNTIPPQAWETLLTASQSRIRQLCAEQKMDIAAITVAGFSFGAANAVRMAEAWPAVVDSGASIGSMARPQGAEDRLPWLTIQAYGDGPFQQITLADFFTTRSPSYGTSGVFPINDFTLHTGPEFRFKESFDAWRHYDTPLQNALARSFVRSLPPDRKITPEDGPELRRQAKTFVSFTPQIEAISDVQSGPTPAAQAPPIIAAVITPTAAPRGVVISLPSEDGTSADDTALVELCWWSEKGWAGIVAPAATAADLDLVLEWVKSHPSWASLPCYVVLHEANPKSSELWIRALEYAKAGHVRSLGWIANTDLLYQTPEAAIRWCGPTETEFVNPEFHLFISHGVSLESRDLRPTRSSFPVVLAANQVPLRPTEESARLALSRIFRLDALQAQEPTLGAGPN